jgi:hypothetical protein
MKESPIPSILHIIAVKITSQESINLPVFSSSIRFVFRINHSVVSEPVMPGSTIHPFI